MPFLNFNDLRVNYEINGEGPALILLPGLLGTIETDWRRFIPGLSTYNRTIALDLRGHGRTNNPAPAGKAGTGELSMNQLVADLFDVFDQLGIEGASILGYSLGGAIGLLAGLQSPGRIKALVMHATKFFWDAASLSAMAANLDPVAMLEKSPRYALSLQKEHGAVYGDDYWKALVSMAGRFVLTMPEQGPSVHQGAQAGIPVLVSVGDHDQLVSLEEAVKLFHTLPKGELAVLPETRHQLQSVRADVFLPIVWDFLERAT